MAYVFTTTLEARLAAGRMVLDREVTGYGHNEVVNFVMSADQSLFYSQACIWLETPPDFMLTANEEMYRRAFKFIRRTVETGFVDDTWWNAERFLEVPEGLTFNQVVMVEYLILSQAVLLLAINRRKDKTISNGFGVFSEIILGKDWPMRFIQLAARITTKLFDRTDQYRHALLIGSPVLMDFLKVYLEGSEPIQSLQTSPVRPAGI